MRRKHLGHTLTFDELPVGACFAFSPNAKRPTGKKTGSNRVLTIPHGSVTVVRTPRLPVREMSCRAGLGGARRRRRKGR